MVVKGNLVEIMDTTGRDGEQTKGVNLKDSKLLITQRLDEAGVDHIEVGSSLWGAPESQEELEAVKAITQWAEQNNCLQKIELLSFLDDRHIDWVIESGVKVVNLLCEASVRFAKGKLQQSTTRHIAVIRHMIDEYYERGIIVNLYFEDWSEGWLRSKRIKPKSHLEKMLDAFANDEKVERIMFCDTMGLLNPDQVAEAVTEAMNQYPKAKFDFHGHNDRAMGTANTLKAVKSGIRCVHVTVNGLGERAGNVPLDEAVANLHCEGYRTNVNELTFYRLKVMVEAFSRIRCALNKPMTGKNAGVHVAGPHQKDRKLYKLVFPPERFGLNIDDDAIGKLTGRSAIRNTLDKLNIPVELSEEQQQELRRRTNEMSKIKIVTRGDFLYLLADILGQPEIKAFKIERLSLLLTAEPHSSSTQLKPTASLMMSFRGKTIQKEGKGDGKFDAAMNAVRKAQRTLKFKMPNFEDYDPRIPPGGDSSSPVEGVITWEFGGETFITSGLNTDQDLAAIEALEKAINVCNNGNHAN